MRKRRVRKRPRPGARRLVLEMAEEVVRALKGRAGLEGTTVSKLVEAWVRSWPKR